MDSSRSSFSAAQDRRTDNETCLSGVGGPVPQLALLDLLFPGFSGVSGVVLRYLGIDLNLYVPLLVLVAGLTFAWDYVRDYFWAVISNHFMSTVEIRVDDEIYNMVMAWVAKQSFSKSSRRFVVNTNLSSRSWNMWSWDSDDDDENSDDEDDASVGHNTKPLAYTPSSGTHTFWYKSRLLLFQRVQNRDQAGQTVSEREEISISCLGRNPWALKELLLEARHEYINNDSSNTLIYRGTCKGTSSNPMWQRCLSRASRPLNTVILSEAKRNQIVEDIADYLSPATRRWYSNRGIPYRRGYLLYGPPGTGKSSLSLALAGHFRMRIYIVSLNSICANEENLGTLFADLPRRCVVLLEDIDTAGLTNTREALVPSPKTADGEEPTASGTPKQTEESTNAVGQLSLSGLLNILDGVASQEGRLLIMTTNHLEKLDKALIRPGRVDMTVKFGRANGEVAASIFSVIYTKMEGDEVDVAFSEPCPHPRPETKQGSEGDEIRAMAEKFAARIPDDEFSPAEIQGYLLRHKRSPNDAVANVGPWVEEMRKQKRERGLAQAEQVKFGEGREKFKDETKTSDEKREGHANGG